MEHSLKTSEERNFSEDVSYDNMESIASEKSHKRQVQTERHIQKDSIEKSIQDILDVLEPEAQRLQKTPHRVAQSYEEFFKGYTQSPEQIVGSALYDSPTEEMVLLCDIPFTSHCEHHMIPIIGFIHIGYIPDGKIIGASKLARFVDCFAYRLQLQERLTVEIATVLEQILVPKGVATYAIAEHFCISRRGVKKAGTKLITRHFSGMFRTDSSLRAEFLDSIPR
ncbi:MAG: GTP cyclohydrolase I FolE [Holosporales bacterium]|jgi:GTP cyclohydrolase I|nr:GTP cyclohydrolase I FolE [Holosporales bacterium]